MPSSSSPGATAAEPERSPDAAAGAAAHGLLEELRRLGGALRQLFGAQMQMLAAELGLARSAVSLMLLLGLAATISGVGLGLTLLGLAAFALAQWLGWLWSLAVLCLVQAVFLLLALWAFRRCMHWLSFPTTRGQWGVMMRQTVQRAQQQQAEAGGEEH